MLELLLLGIISFLFFSLGCMLCILSYRLFTASDSAYDTAQKLSKDLNTVIKGQVSTHEGGVRDLKVRAGISLNKQGKWQIEGQLADETVQAVVGK